MNIQFKKLFIAAILCNTSFTSYAQDASQPSNMKTAVPSYFTRFTDIPVSLYTGTPNISIPICALQSGKLSIPVSIEYHASGIKVNDISGPVGLGWRLNAGGFIVRVVKGIPDEGTNGYCGSAGVGTKVQQYFYYKAAGWGLPFSEDDYRASILKEEYDSQPDVFYFDLPGLSGKFVIDASGTPVLTPAQDIDIKPAFGPQGTSDGRWELTDANGVKYILGRTTSARESVQYQVTGGPVKEIPTTWYLEEISSPYNDKITITYTTSSNYSYTTTEQIKYNLISSWCNFYPTDCGHRIGYSEDTVRNYNTVVTFFNHKIINQIIGGQQYLTFLYATDVQEVAGKPYLISIRGGTKKYDLGYGYFTGDCNGGSCARLKLNSIQEIAYSGERLPPHQFVYNEAVQLPERNSPKQDYWGYYNNNPNDDLALPGSYPLPNKYLGLGADRSPDESKMQACILQKIIYPTGGSVAFTYEAHRYYDAGTLTDKLVGGVRIKQIIANDGVGNTYKNYTYKDENTALSSGKIFALPKYNYVKFMEDGYTDFQTFVVDYRYLYYCRSSASLIDLRNEEGEYIGYGTVTEEVPGIGKKVYNFSNYDTDPDLMIGQNDNVVKPYAISGTDVVSPPRISKNYKRGLLTGYKEYDNSASLLKSTTNTYTFPSVYFNNNADFIYAYLIYRNVQTEYNTPSLFPYVTQINEAYKCFYGYKSEKVLLDTRIEKTYIKDEGGTARELVTQSVYGYSTLGGHSNPVSITQTYPNGEVYVTTMAYPKDCVPNADFVADLIQKHIISPVLEKTVAQKDPVSGSQKILSGEINTFTASTCLPYEKYTLDITSPVPSASFKFSNIMGAGYPGTFIPDTRYKRKTLNEIYDTYGNVQQSKPEGGYPVAYIWGYNGAYTTAQANAPLNKIAYTSFEETTVLGGWTYTPYTSADCQTSCLGSYLSAATSACSSPCTTACAGNSGCYTNCMSGCVPSKQLEIATASGCITSCNGGAKTGSASFYGNSITKTSLPTGNYVLSFWAKRRNVNANLSATVVVNSASQSVSSTTWQYYEVPLTGITSVSLTLTNAQIDELRLHPSDAQMTTYTYSPLIGITSATDENNVTTYYEYDSLGRLQLVRDQDSNILKTYQYHYKGQ